MDLPAVRMTVEGPGGDVDLAVAAGVTLAQVRADLLTAADLPPGSSLWALDQALVGTEVVGLPPLLDGAVLATSSAARSRPAAGELVLAVTAGPDAGRVHRLAGGPGVTVGRSAAAELVLADPLLSRVHATVVPAPDERSATVTDHRSTNGTTVPSGVVCGGRAYVPIGHEMRLGASRLSLLRAPADRASFRPDGCGHLVVNRPPLPVPPRPVSEVGWPAKSEPQRRTRFSVIGIALPVVGGLVLAAVTRSTAFLALAALSPLMLLGSWLSDLAAHRRERRASGAAYDVALAAARRDLDCAVDLEREWWRTTAPDLAALVLTAGGTTTRLWHRRGEDPSHLVLRLGLGDHPAGVVVTGVPPPSAVQVPVLVDVPITVALGDVGVLGIAGPRERVLALARGLVAQVVTWHGPDDVRLTVLARDGCEQLWEWTRWLPHSDRFPYDSAGLSADLERRLATRHDPRSSHPVHVVVLDDAGDLRSRPGVTRLLQAGPEVGVHLMCLDTTATRLPVECAATVLLADHGHPGASAGATARSDVLVRPDGTTQELEADGLGATTADQVARALAPLQVESPTSGRAVHPRDLLALMGMPAVDRAEDLCAAVRRSWGDAGTTTRVPVGTDVDGQPVHLDLATDGPHALVAGTTGAGKSELLQTLVGGLALVNRPDRLSIVLVDYKGGAAFRHCARLPHVVGCVTDLDEQLTTRALTSLRAELRRRERLLRAADCADFASYERREPGRDGGTMPRLVIVVDEFAALVSELPDFVTGLVGIAQRGRSLGVHLVLATQRPAGSVNAEIRANTSLRVALRVADPQDSADVVDCIDAALLPASSPGRAVVRRGNEPVAHVQVARLALPAARAATVRVLRAAAVEPAGEATGVDDAQAGLVAAVAAAAAAEGAQRGAAPWAEPLPDTLSAAELEPWGPGLARSGGRRASVGLLDQPDRQCLAPMTVALDGGEHLLVAGGPRSGRTTALRLVALQLAARVGPDDLHLHAIAPDGGLADVCALPHTGTVVDRSDPALAGRLLRRLADEADTRRRHPADHPWSVLLLDDWEATADLLDAAPDGADCLLRLVRAGPDARTRVVAAGGRALLTSRLAGSVRRRLVLRMADAGDYAVAGVAVRSVPRAMPAGRGLLLPEEDLVQLALPPATAGPAARWTSDTSERRPPARRPLRLRRLPTCLDLADLLAAAPGDDGRHGPDPGWLPIGVAGDDASPVGVDLVHDGPGVVVAGPPGSGRSTALAVMASWLLRQQRPLTVLTHPRSPLWHLRAHGVPVLGPDGDDALVAQATERPGTVVLVDDVECVAGRPAEGRLQELLRPGGPAVGGVVVSGATADLAGSFRGLGVDVRRGRTGLLLGPPGRGDGELLGVRLPVAEPGSPPGRGVLVVRGRATPVQAARVDLSGQWPP